MGDQQNKLNREDRMRFAQGQPVHPTDDRDATEIKQDIRRTRGAMDETLDELGERLNPRNLLDDVIDVFRSPSSRRSAKRAGDAASDFAGNLGRQVRDNPIGSTLVGAGLAWLAFGGSESGRRHESRSEFDFDDEQDGYRDSGYCTDEDLILERTYSTDPQGAEIVVPESYDQEGSSESTFGQLSGKASSAAAAAGESAESAWESTKDTASTAASSVADAASATGEAISDAASSVAGGVKSAASSVAGTASSVGSTSSDAARRAYFQSRAAGRGAYRNTARTARSARTRAGSASRTASDQLSDAYAATRQRAERAHDEAPLALGLGIMAAGAIVGALIPRTRREDKWMGETSDEAIAGARHQAEMVYEQSEAAVQRTVETVKDSADSQGLTGDSLAERATRVAEAAASSVSEAAKEEGLHPKQLKDDAKSVANEGASQAKSEVKTASQDAKKKAAEMDSDAKKAIDK